MNEKKFYLQHYTKGVQFTGAIVKRDRLYAVNTTIESYRKAVIKLNAACQSQNIEAISRAVQSVNSYLGIFSHYNEYGIKRQILKEELAKESWRFLVVKGHFRSIHLRRKFNDNSKYISMANKMINNERKSV